MDAQRVTPRHERPRVHLHLETHDVGRDPADVDAHSLEARCLPGERSGEVHVPMQLASVMVERVQRGRGEDPRLPHPTPELLLEAPGPIDRRAPPSQRRAHGRTQPLAEAHVDGIERLGEVVLRNARGGRSVPEPGTIEMEAEAAFTTYRAYGAHSVERPDRATARVVCVLQA